ncbi:magnesium transporter CorA family protein [Armatimonas rosea]|uniref:Mg2+ and Co2+ transporter CorA n=1 Tax=Armatimonas rosea TaxID=685828 RepID=A0A7W9SWH6_ARMRO|nr:CorA family divalent cation transporter [Armatimonas rosea]MBB6053514.1 Mg2+ and Co2+ transporter CorA [Armatimonas rosea]
MQATLFDTRGLDRTVALRELPLTELTANQVLWIDVDRNQQRDLTELATWLGIPSLGLPVETEGRSRPRVDNYGSWLKVRVLIPSHDISLQALYFLVGSNWIVTVHDGVVEPLENFERQIRDDSQLGQLCASSFLAAMLDWHLTSFFRTIERLEAEVDSWDDLAMAAAPATPILPQLRRLRQKIAALRRALVPHREVYSALLRPDIVSVFGNREQETVFPTLWSQLERAIDSIDNARELVLGSFEMYTAQVAQKTNDVMRLLTVVTVLLLPIGTLAGVLGMNFQARLFTTQDRGFWITVGVMLTLMSSGGLLAHRRGWIGG